MMYQNVVSVPVCVDKSGHKSGKDFELEIYSAKILSLPPFHTTRSIAFDRFGCDYRRMKEKFEDTKGVIRSHNSKTRQIQGSTKKGKKDIG